ncbi:MAG: hypothetical protein WD276_05630 [Actinomycetota bacterium]
MQDEKQALLDAEATYAAEIEQLAMSRTPDEVSIQDLNDDGWSVKTLVVHIAHWQRAGAEAIDSGAGEYEGSDEDSDRVNAGILARAQGMSWKEALDDWADAREGARMAFASVEPVPEWAITWFTDEGTDHMAEHLVELRRWAAR